MKFGFYILMLCLGIASSAFASPWGLDMAPEHIADRNYQSKVEELLTFAAESIDLSLEELALSYERNDPVAELMEKLIVASKKGVKVRLFLNTFSAPQYDASVFLRDDVLTNLTENGVTIHFVDPNYQLMDRLLVIDKRIVLEGGPTWTSQGLQESLSSATLIYSVDIALAKKKRLELLPLWNIKVEREKRIEGQLAVPLFLLKDIKYFPGMLRSEDGDAMKVYLALLRSFYETQQLELTALFTTLARNIPASDYYGEEGVIFQVMAALQRLKEQYELIEIVAEEADRFIVKLKLPTDLKPVVGVPIPFFDENFAKDFEPSSIYMYFLILYRSQTSGQSPVWMGSENNVAQDFPIDRSSYREGIAELRQANLVEIFPFYLKQGEATKTIQKPEYRYLLNPIPSLSERLAIWERLRNQYGDFSFEKARVLAKLLGEPGDPKVVVAYAQMLDEFSIEDVRSLTEHVVALPQKSTPEMLDYIRTLLKNEIHGQFQLTT